MGDGGGEHSGGGSDLEALQDGGGERNGGAHAGNLTPNPGTDNSEKKRIRPRVGGQIRSLSAASMGGKTSILIVEDSATQALLLESLLSRHFGPVRVAHSGQEALGLMCADAPTLVISDVNMPEMDGYELCKRIQSEPALAKSPVLLITSLIDLADVVKGLECGAIGFLTKPYSETQLVERIRFLLAHPELCTAARAAKGIEVKFGGQRYVIGSEREQILSFLLSAYELALLKNRDINEASEALAAQKRELERSNQELEQFAHIASHDLQAPLRTLSGYLEILEQNTGHKLDAKEQGYLQYAMDGARRMQQMISDLLVFSNVGSQSKTFTKVDLGQALENALANLEAAIFARGAVVTHDPMPSALVDASQFTQVLQNLVGNALKFCRDRTPRIHVGWERRWGGEWIFSVRDNGIGIEPENFDKIFNLFERIHEGQEFSGSGMGLAICKKIVERHGGRIWLESELGQGTTVFFTLPELVDPKFRGI
jgi:signal transduction histidine kinase